MNIDKRLVRKDSLEKLFDILKQNSKKIYAPFSKDGKTVFKDAGSFAGISTEYIQTTQSSKDIAFPATKRFSTIPRAKRVCPLKGLI
jgi:hypothetical protein